MGWGEGKKASATKRPSRAQTNPAPTDRSERLLMRLSHLIVLRLTAYPKELIGQGLWVAMLNC